MAPFAAAFMRGDVDTCFHPVAHDDSGAWQGRSPMRIQPRQQLLELWRDPAGESLGLIEVNVINGRSPNVPQLTDFATYLLGGTDHLYDQELLSGSTASGASDALRKLDQLSLARQDAPGVA